MIKKTCYRAILIDSESKRDAEFDYDGVSKRDGDVERWIQQILIQEKYYLSSYLSKFISTIFSSIDELSEVEAAQTSEREGHLSSKMKKYHK